MAQADRRYANLHAGVALRKILGPAAIATVPGQGYRFTMEVTPEVVDSELAVTVARTGGEQLQVAGESIHPVPALTSVVAADPALSRGAPGRAERA